MTLYRDMTTSELTDYAMIFDTIPPARRLIYALASRLEQEYQRANNHRDRAIEVQRLRIEHQRANRHRDKALDVQRQPGPIPAGYIKVAKPHIQQVFTVPSSKGMWRCTGPFGTVQYGPGPGEAYAAWRLVMERGHGIPRK